MLRLPGRLPRKWEARVPSTDGLRSPQRWLRPAAELHRLGGHRRRCLRAMPPRCALAHHSCGVLSPVCESESLVYHCLL